MQYQIEKVQCSATCFVTNDFSYFSSVATMLDQASAKKLPKADNVLQNCA